MPPFHRPRSLELQFQRALDALMRQWIKGPRGDNLDEIFEFLTAEGNDRLIKSSDRLARGMVTAVAKGNAISWRQAAMQSTQSRRIHDLLAREMSGPVGAIVRGLIKEQARQIRSVPQSVAQDVAKQIATRQMRGERAEVIARDIGGRMRKISQARIAMLARTQVSSTATAISEARADHLNLPAYEWLTAEDVRVRDSHVEMDHVIVLWADPPAPETLIGEKSKLGRYHAGQCPNCRCDANVIVDLDQLEWPHKVHVRGSIVRMSRSKFRQLIQ